MFEEEARIISSCSEKYIETEILLLLIVFFAPDLVNCIRDIESDCFNYTGNTAIITLFQAICIERFKNSVLRTPRIVIYDLHVGTVSSRSAMYCSLATS